MRHAAQVAVLAVFTLPILPSARAETPARIYVYAQMETDASMWRPIFCDGTAVAKLKRGRFFAVDVAPGRHLVSDEHGIPVMVDARSGEESFVSLVWHIEVDKPPISVLRVVPGSVARREMLHLAYIDAGKVLSKSVPKVAPRWPPQLMRREGSGDE